MNNHKHIEQLIAAEISTHFQHHCNILLQDSPQFLDDYIYIEFDDANGSDAKFRIPYPYNKKTFIMDTSPTDQILYILKNIIKQYFRPAF